MIVLADDGMIKGERESGLFRAGSALNMDRQLGWMGNNHNSARTAQGRYRVLDIKSTAFYNLPPRGIFRYCLLLLDSITQFLAVYNAWYLPVLLFMPQKGTQLSGGKKTSSHARSSPIF